MKEKTLVCIIAETRESQFTWPSFKENVLDQLNADLALCISVPANYDYSNPMWQHAKYKWITPEYKNWLEAFEHAKETEFANTGDDWKWCLDIKCNGFAPINGDKGAGAILIYYRWLLLYNLQQEGLLEKYDRFIVTRSDFLYLSPHPLMEYLDPLHPWAPNSEHCDGITDRHAVLSKSTIVSYLSIMKNIFYKDQNLWLYCQNHNPIVGLERIVKVSWESERGPNSWRYFPYIMYAVRHEGTSTRWAEGYFNPVLQYYIKYPVEFNTALHYQQRLKNNQDWKQWYDTAVKHLQNDEYVY